MSSEQSTRERFCLLPVVRGANRGKLMISRLVLDISVDPIWREIESFGPFADRQEAREFMLARSSS